ncbi:MAG: glycosyltransferase family 2 protein [Roseiflexaceae bacterium]
MAIVIDILFWLIALPLAATVAYLLLLTAAAALAPRHTPARSTRPDRRFVILIPAHNEERLLPSLLASLARLDYPRELYQVHVVADNCADRTAELARAAGATAHERHDTEQIGKGYALRWLIGRVQAAGWPYDAAVILDADTVVAPNLLTVMDARLARGERAIQCYYAVREPERSWGAALRAVALAALHYLRPLGRMVLGGSAGLKGNGMVFAADLTRRYEWPASLTEDIEYHMALILGGERVTFAPDAVIWAEMPGTLAAASTQNARWERGRLEMVRRYVPRLLRAALERRSFLLFDAAIEQLIPPFSLIAAAALVALALAPLAGSTALVLALLLIISLALYILTGLLLAGAPRRIYQALLYAPVFLVWKLWLYVRVALGRDRSGWVRTARNQQP